MYNKVAQGALILFEQYREGRESFGKRISDLCNIDWSDVSFFEFQAMCVAEGAKKNPWTKEWNNLHTTTLAKLWVIINQPQSGNLKKNIINAGFKNDNVSNLLLKAKGMLVGKTMEIIEQSDLFNETELKMIKQLNGKLTKARTEDLLAIKQANKETRKEVYKKVHKEEPAYVTETRKVEKKLKVQEEAKKDLNKVFKQEAKNHTRIVKSACIVINLNKSKWQNILYAIKSILKNNYKEGEFRVRN